MSTHISLRFTISDVPTTFDKLEPYEYFAVVIENQYYFAIKTGEQEFEGVLDTHYMLKPISIEELGTLYSIYPVELISQEGRRDYIYRRG